MKPLITFIALLLFALNAYCQEPGIINDHDGFVNVRKEPASSSPIAGKIYTNSVFYFETNKTDWYTVYHDENLEDKKESSTTGYIHKSRILPLKNIPHLSKKQVFKDSCLLNNDSIKLAVSRSPFDVKKEYCKKR